MENYSYSYPDSGDSSPRSREIDFENPPTAWEEQPLPGNYKVKFMVSYGGKIQPRHHDNQLAYVGGETKILSVERGVKFPSFLSKLAALCGGEFGSPESVTFKYQLPGEDLDALISVTNDDDLEHMMHELDRLYRSSPKPARLRLFLFTVNQQPGFGSGSSEGVISSGGPVADSAAAPPPRHQPANNVDFLFGFEKSVGVGVPPAPAPVPVVKVHDPIPEPQVHLGSHHLHGDQIEARVQDLNRLQISGHERIYQPKSEDNLVGGGFSGDGYVHKMPEKVPPVSSVPHGVASTVQIPASYWPPQEKNIPGGVFPTSRGIEVQHQQPQSQHPVYMIPAPQAPAAGVYHAAPQVRPVTGQPSQGYYQVQRIPSEVYREQQMYNMGQPVSAPPPQSVPATLPPQPQAKMAAPAYTVGLTETGFTQVAYDSATGRQVYYAAPGGGVTTSYQGMVAAAGGGPVNATGLTGGDGKGVNKFSPTSAAV